MKITRYKNKKNINDKINPAIIMPIASSFFFGKINAISKRPADILLTIPTRAMYVANTAKSSGDHSLVKTGIIIIGIAYAMLVPFTSVKTWRLNLEFSPHISIIKFFFIIEFFILSIKYYN
jgi:hypothetical protein